jgi:Holliday junction resolvase RusA-like endonuclease
MSSAITITIPFKAVSVNSLYINVRGRGRILSAEAKRWKQAVTSIAAQSKGRLPRYALYSIEITVFDKWLTKKGVPCKRDIDNVIKALVDSVASGLGFDDSCVFDIRAIKQHSSETPHIIVRIGGFAP